MRNIIRTGKLIFVILLLPLLANCGGGGETASTTSSSPVISNLQYTITSNILGSGIQTANWSFDFSDNEGDVEFLRVTDSEGADLTSQILNISGVVSGTIQTAGSFSTDNAGTKSFTVWVQDANGNSSNKLTVSIMVYPLVKDTSGTYTNTINNLNIDVLSFGCSSMFDSGDFTVSNHQTHPTYTCIVTGFDLTDLSGRQLSCGATVFRPSLCGGQLSPDFGGEWNCGDPDSTNTYLITLNDSVNSVNVTAALDSCDK